MKFNVTFNKIAKQHLIFIQKSGDKASLKKLNKILDELETKP